MAKPKRFQGTFELGGMKYTPEKLAEDGTLKTLPRLELALIHAPQGTGATLARFLPDAVGELHATVDVEEVGKWSGFVRIGTVSWESAASKARDEERGRTEHPTIKFPLKVAPKDLGAMKPLRELFNLRSEASSVSTSSATVALQVYQENLDWDDDDEPGDEDEVA